MCVLLKDSAIVLSESVGGAKKKVKKAAVPVEVGLVC